MKQAILTVNQKKLVTVLIAQKKEFDDTDEIDKLGLM